MSTEGILGARHCSSIWRTNPVEPIFLGREMDLKINEQIHEQSEERQPGIHHGRRRLLF